MLNIIIPSLACFQKPVSIIEDCLDPVVITRINPLMINNRIHVIWIIIVLETGQLIIFPVFMKIRDEVGYAGVEKFHTAQPLYIGCDHQRIHALDLSAYVHQLCHFTGKLSNAFMNKIYIMFCFIGQTPLPETL